MTKEEMEAVWRKPRMIYLNHRVIWTEFGHKAGEKVHADAPDPFRRLPCQHTLRNSDPFPMPKELRESIKHLKNYRALKAAYGITETAYERKWRLAEENRNRADKIKWAQARRGWEEMSQ